MKRQTIALFLLSTSLMTAFSPMLSSQAVTEEMNSTESVEGNPIEAPAPTTVEVPTPPIEVPTPPVEVSTPPIEVPTPPVEVSTPPIEVPTPPVEVSTPPVGDVGRTPETSTNSSVGGGSSSQTQPIAPSTGTILQGPNPSGPPGPPVGQGGPVLSPDFGKIIQVPGGTGSIFKGILGGAGESTVTWQLPKHLEDAGWVIIGSSVNVTSKTGKGHRSGYRTSFAGSHSSFSSSSLIKNSLNLQFNAAVTAGNTKLAAELKAAIDKLESSSFTMSATHNTAVLTVWAKAGAATRAGITADMTVTLLKTK